MSFPSQLLARHANLCHPLRVTVGCTRSFAILLLAGCAASPLPVDSEHVLATVAARYEAFFAVPGDPQPGSDAGVLRPRFGLPALAQAGAGFDIELLERGAPGSPTAVLVGREVGDDAASRCLRGAVIAGCHRLALSLVERMAVPTAPLATVAHLVARPTDSVPPGGWDLVVSTPADAPVRLPRAVWLRADDPAALRSLRVAVLSDLHVGKATIYGLEERLRAVIAEVNATAPDLVLAAGDLANRGTDAGQIRRARDLLVDVEAPVLAVIGNHDLGFTRDTLIGNRYGAGWEHFGQVFHPHLHYRFSLGGWDFIGFDSGPLVFSLRILTRGLTAETVAALRREVDAAAHAGRGVVLLSHAPTRAVLTDNARADTGGGTGQMRAGGRELEAVLLEAARRGQPVLHVTGHTHWSDVFEAHAGSGRAFHFERWPAARLSPCPTPIDTRAALITVQSATHSGVPWKATARGWGFALLTLDRGTPSVAFIRHGLGREAAHCMLARPR